MYSLLSAKHRQNTFFGSVFTRISGKCCNKLNKRVKTKREGEEQHSLNWRLVFVCLHGMRIDWTFGKTNVTKMNIQTKQLSVSAYYILCIWLVRCKSNTDERCRSPEIQCAAHQIFTKLEWMLAHSGEWSVGEWLLAKITKLTMSLIRPH